MSRDLLLVAAACWLASCAHAAPNRRVDDGARRVALLEAVNDYTNLRTNIEILRLLDKGEAEAARKSIFYSMFKGALALERCETTEKRPRPCSEFYDEFILKGLQDARKYVRELPAERNPFESDPETRFLLLDTAALHAYHRGDLAEAKRLASELLRILPKWKENWNYGNAIHLGNSVLGLVALDQDDLSSSIDYLLASARIDGSCQLNSFGPKLELATRLYDRGQHKPVREFLEAVGAFWRDPTLAIWLKDLDEGRQPDFLEANRRKCR